MASILQRMRRADPTALSDAMGRAGAMTSAIKPVWAGARLVGRAFTVRAVPGDFCSSLVAMTLMHRGEVLVPGGSARDVFLYVKDDLLDEALPFFSERLAGRAEVHPVQQLIAQGFFGPAPVSQALLDRVGNLVILPYEYQSVWWYEKGKFEQRFYGHHGGLTRQEMEIPFLLYSI